MSTPTPTEQIAQIIQGITNPLERAQAVAAALVYLAKTARPMACHEARHSGYTLPQIAVALNRGENLVRSEIAAAASVIRTHSEVTA